MTATIAPGFIVIHGNQSETLRDLLRDWVRAHPLSPLENDIILVQSNGVAQWLTLSLAADPDAEGGGGLGIAAATELQLPSRFIWQAYRHVLGSEVVPVRAPLGKDLLTWRLMRLLPALLDGPDRELFAPLARFLQDDPHLRRRHQLAARLADLFDQYQVYRADWLDDWAAGRDVLRTQRRGTEPLKEDVRWQAALWRVLLEDAAEVADGNRAAIHQRFMAACADSGRARPPALPRRILVFGISALPRQALDVLAALGRWCQVLMFVQNPCRHYWGDIVPERDLLSARRSRHQPRAAHGGSVPQLVGLDHGHALLAAWGRQGRDLIGLLSEHDDLELSESRLAGISRRADVFVDAPADTLLMQLQQDILDLAPLAETRGRWPAVDADRDVSVRFHACHSPQREVEVLHDQLLTAFAEDPGLRPRDVMVMVPDIAVFAPHIEAVFGLHPADDPRHIPFSIADQARRAEEPLLQALEFLLSLPQSRIGATDVLDLLDVSAVQQRFGIERAQLPTIRQWIQASGIRWGLDRTQRAALDLGEPVDRNSWRFGLQRMLLGYAVGSGGAWADIEPLDEISGLDASLLGQLMALIDALNETWQALSEPALPAVWVERLRAMLGRFFSADEQHEALILLRLEESLLQWQADCEDTRLDLPLPLSVVREHWLASVEDDGLNRRFLAGGVTFATLMPMRAIPFRRVCLLGMNDKEFPRERVPMDFDLMAHDYRPGDRSRREDDRYLFLEALLSARERLYISWQGRSIHDDSVRPPSVLVAQLRDHLAAGWHLRGATADDADALLKRLTTQHRLQPFARAYFVGTSAGAAPDGLFSHAHEWREALQRSRDADAREGDDGRWPVLPMEAGFASITLDELGAFLRAPVRTFLNRRLGIHLGHEEDENLDLEPFSLDGLQRWKIDAQLIEGQQDALMQGLEPGERLSDAMDAVMRRGVLPVGGFGELLAENIEQSMRELFEEYQKELAVCPDPLEDLAFEWRPAADEAASGLPAVSGRIDSLRQGAGGARWRVLVSASRLIEKVDRGGDRWRYDKLLPFWVTHVAAQLDGVPLTTVVCSPKGILNLPPLDAVVAAEAWHGMLRAWAEGICSPLPFAARTGVEWFFERHEHVAPAAGDSSSVGQDERAVPMESRASRRYEGDERTAGECARDEHLQRVFPDFARLWSGGRFADWAECLYRPLIDTVKPLEKAGGSRRGRRDGDAADSAGVAGTGEASAVPSGADEGAA